MNFFGGKTGLRDQINLITYLCNPKLRIKRDCKAHLTNFATVIETLALTVLMVNQKPQILV